MKLFNNNNKFDVDFLYCTRTMEDHMKERHFLLARI